MLNQTNKSKHHDHNMIVIISDFSFTIKTSIQHRQLYVETTVLMLSCSIGSSVRFKRDSSAIRNLSTKCDMEPGMVWNFQGKFICLAEFPFGCQMTHLKWAFFQSSHCRLNRKGFWIGPQGLFFTYQWFGTKRGNCCPIPGYMSIPLLRLWLHRLPDMKIQQMPKVEFFSSPGIGNLIV